MSTLLEILVHDILPVFIVIGLGYAFARRNHPELRTATRLTFYVLSPCLVFVSLVESNMDGGETAQIFIFVLLMVLVMGALAWLTGRAMHLTPPQTDRVSAGRHVRQRGQLRAGRDAAGLWRGRRSRAR